MWDAAALAVAMGMVYVSTLLPGIGYAGDVVKFQFVGHVLGTPHAPGYPLYLGINHVFTHGLPVGTVAWRANLLSALFAVAALLVLHALLRRFGCGRAVAATVAVAAGCLPAVWSQAVVAEVYTLHLLLVVATLLLLIRWRDRKRRGDLVAALATFSLAFAHHLTIVTLVPAVLGFILVVDRSALRPRSLAGLSPVALLGLLPYGYLFWRTGRPATTYLEIQTPDLATWLWYLGGGQFRERIFAFGLTEMLTERLPLVGGLMLGQLGPVPDGSWLGWRAAAGAVTAVLVLAGVLALRGAARHVLLVGTLVGNTVYVLGYDIPDIGAYLLPTYAVLAIYAGVGLEHFLDRLPRRARPVAFGLLPLAVVALFLEHRPAMDRSAHRTEETWAASVLAAIDSDAGAGRSKVIIAGDYLTYETLQYVRQIGLPQGGAPRRDLLVMTPLLPGNVMPEVHAFVERHQPPALVRHQLLSAHTPTTVRRYLVGQGDLRSFEERSKVPRGLPVYALGEAQRALLVDAGMTLELLDPGIFRVASPAVRASDVP